jgi:hypothetical protein
MKRPIPFVLSAVIFLATLTFLACTPDPDKRVDAEVTRKIALGDYDGARLIAVKYIPSDLDLTRANARLVLINAEESKAYLPQVTVVGNARWTRSGDDVLVQATIRNNGLKPLRYLEMTMSFVDSAGKVVDTASGLFANPVPPGATRELEVVRRNPPRFRDVTARVEDLRVQ